MNLCYSEKFEATNNMVELRLHLAPCYRLENGALQPANREDGGRTSLSFDRRKTVGDLRLAIYQVTSFPKIKFRIIKRTAERGRVCICVLSVQMQELWEGDMALTVAKSLPAGLHLYNTLTGETFSKICQEDTVISVTSLLHHSGCVLSFQMTMSPCTVQASTQTMTCLCGTAER